MDLIDVMKLNKVQASISDSLSNGFVDQRFDGTESLMPSFIYNKKGDSMLLHIERELDQCSSFTFVIAFITKSALSALKVKLADLNRQGIRGRILTADYLNFNNPEVFQDLKRIPNLDVRIANTDNFHAKGYIFDHAKDNYQSAIIGSSNLTANAIMFNYEWNIKFTSYDNGAITEQLIQEVENSWTQAEPLSDSWIEKYRIQYEKNKQQLSDSKEIEAADDSSKYVLDDGIKPNKMQNEALKSLENIRKQGANKALIVSATGTGKTYLGAFDVASYQPTRFLYIVHRAEILTKTVKSFKEVLRAQFYEQHRNQPSEQALSAFNDQFGVVSGKDDMVHAKYVFATIQTLANSERLGEFKPNDFDYILIDEAHRAGGQTYQKVVNFFKPNFLLGMTATPERMDSFNLYEMFDYHIAYEIRLQKALDEKMLCPFRYIGVTDYEQGGQTTDDTSQLKWLVSEERVNYIIKQTDYYNYSGEVLHGLIFCSRTAEANELARMLTVKGFPSEALTGDTSHTNREETIRKLKTGELSYIITVDVFNEGIDIQCVNQIVMLRNTQSSIVFIQQLGRGLRKYPDKEYLTVVDFIGNYKNNYLIPIALNGDKSRSKSAARDDLEIRQISGVSTVSFSEIAKEKIYQSINNTALNSLKILREDYQDLKKRLGKIPLMADFQGFGTVDAVVFADKFNNYYQFLLKMKEEIHLTFDEEAVLSFISMELMNGKRVIELLLLKKLIENKGVYSKSQLKQQLQEQQVYNNATIENSVEDVLSLSFFITASQKKYGNQSVVILKNEMYQLNEQLVMRLKDNQWFKKLILDALQVGIMKANAYQQDQQFTLYQRYTRKDVCRLLGWDNDVSSTVYGYRVRQGACPIFVTYAKSDEIDDSIRYQDRFINTNIFQWYTRHNVKLASKEVQQMLDKNTDIHLFIKKNDDEGSDFYYFGQVDIKDTNQEKVKIKDQDEPIVKMLLQLQAPARYDKYLLFEK